MIRPATPADFEELQKLAVRMHRESNYSTIPYDPVRSEAFVKWLLESDDGFVAVYEHDGVVRGFMMAVAMPAWFGNGVDKIANDIVLYVDPMSRHGPAAVLLAHAFKKWACRQASDVRQIRVGTSAGDAGQAANAIYEHLGLSPSGRCFLYDVKEPHHASQVQDHAAA